MKIIDNIKEKLNRAFDKSGNRQILNLTYIFAIIFVILICYIVVFVIRDSDEVINNSYNKREELYAKKVVRGDILTRNGEVLAYTDTSSGEEVRVYPYGPAFAHVVGYNVKGKAGIESISTFKLLKSNILITNRLYNEAIGVKSPGDSVVTTLDLNAQLAAYSALENKQGAIVMMDAYNGDILAMVSKPDYDPNTILYTWDQMTSDSNNSALLNRCTQGIYPPGSTFKIVTALEYLRENKDTDSYSFDCNGIYEYKGTSIRCFHSTAHGNVSFDTSFAKSCNSSFANITTTLNKSEFRNTCTNLLFNSEVPCPLYVRKSFVPIDSSSSVDELMQTGIGQGKTEITPYHMCLISAAIANKGILINPRIIREIETAEGDHVIDYGVKEYKRLISEEDSVKLKSLMRDVVTEGTGTNLLNTSGYVAYGKTGSAEFSSNKSESHAWFTGFAETDDGGLISISVIVENGGSGGQVAIPIAKMVFDSYINK